jgi:hypothetical protein
MLTNPHIGRSSEMESVFHNQIVHFVRLENEAKNKKKQPHATAQLV